VDAPTATSLQFYPLLPVDLTQSSFFDSLVMLGCAISHMLLKSVSGILGSYLDHFAVSGDFGEDAGCTNRWEITISFDDGLDVDS
jgi:hypothetical protein